MRVSFQTKNYCFIADLNQSRAAQDIIRALPLTSEVLTWGDEIYFKTNITAAQEDLTLDTNIGDVAYWPEGKCICVFFGPTPLSKTEKPVPASEVVIIGKTLTDPEELRKIRDDQEIKLTSENSGPTQPHDERKLSQSEIDKLVQSLLAAKKQ